MKSNNSRSVNVDGARIYIPDIMFPQIVDWKTHNEDNFKICKYLDNFQPFTIDTERLFTSDSISKMHYGEVIFGDIKEFGFIVAKSIVIDDKTERHLQPLKINHLKKSLGISGQKNCKLLFPSTLNIYVLPPIDNKQDLIKQNLQMVLEQLLHTNNISDEYELLLPNILLNSGHIKHYQMAHFDYIPSYNNNGVP